MSLGENVMVSTDPVSETNEGRSREDMVSMILSPFCIKRSSLVEPDRF
jgi:hypothetical protein